MRVYWRGGYIGDAGILERWVYWRCGYIGEAGVSEMRVYWRGGYIGEAGILERRDYFFTPLTFEDTVSTKKIVER